MVLGWTKRKDPPRIALAQTPMEEEMEIKGFAQNLAEYMAKLSNKYYSDRWMVQLEFELWRELVEDPEMLDNEELEKLVKLKDQAEGWVLMNYDSGALEFMSLPKWQSYYQKHKPF